MDQLMLNANVRKETGKVAAKKFRKQGKLPAVMYNSKGEAEMLLVDEIEFAKLRKVATPTSLISLVVDGNKKTVFIKDVHYDIITDKNKHVDFHVIEADKLLRISMKVQVSGNPIGVRDGGMFGKNEAPITIKCLPKDLPARIVADVSNLAVGQAIYVKDLSFGKGVTVISDSEALVAHVRELRT